MLINVNWETLSYLRHKHTGRQYHTTLRQYRDYDGDGPSPSFELSAAAAYNCRVPAVLLICVEMELISNNHTSITSIVIPVAMNPDCLTACRYRRRREWPFKWANEWMWKKKSLTLGMLFFLIGILISLLNEIFQSHRWFIFFPIILYFSRIVCRPRGRIWLNRWNPFPPL